MTIILKRTKAEAAKQKQKQRKQQQQQRRFPKACEDTAGRTFIWGLRQESAAEAAQAGALLTLLALRVTLDVAVAVAAHSWQGRSRERV